MSTQTIPAKAPARLLQERNIWLATNRPDGRPHLTPIWFIWQEDKIFICMKPDSVKARNLAANNAVALSLEDGSDVVICEGTAEYVAPPWSPALMAAFKAKYNWQIDEDKDYGHVMAITPQKWLSWGPA
ncbi:MAG: pyridoxamine 5'-phosphate oxidase family protein [Anaerolineales bacterium]|nr:pyridoxamine 5'-phosphate oxidase family protein [Anaerolineales bacterium]MCB0028237.1 pyridoxamine 5'-phosphate oxidase family protein [Anaerolineales bacterium]